MKALFSTLVLCFTIPTLAEIKVTQVRGKVLYNKEPVSKGMILKESGQILTAKQSLCRLSLTNSNSQVIVGPKSAYMIDEIEKDKGPSTATLLKGTLRYFSSPGTKGKPANIKTKQASMGIRGTDFLLVATALLGETEIVLFEGNVEMTNLSKPSDKLDVKGGQWGGLGGRFGATFQPAISLPKNVLNVFDNKLKK